MKMTFQPPNSTLCIKSGRNIENRLNPSGDNLSEKAFSRSNSSGLMKLETMRNLLMSAPMICPGAGPLQPNCLPTNSSHILASELQLPCLVVLSYRHRPVYFSATCLLPFQCCEPEIMGSNSIDKGTCRDCGCSQSVSYCKCTIKN